MVSSFVEGVPAPGLAGLVSSTWIQRVGDRPVTQRHEPHGGAEVRCVVGAAPRLLGPLTSAIHQDIPAGGTVVGLRLRPGAVSVLAGMPADELVDQVVGAADLWPDTARLTDLVGAAATPDAALGRLQAFLARPAADPPVGPDPLVGEAVRLLMPWHDGGPGALPERLSISERQLRRRCRAAVGVGPKELQRILRLRGFSARVAASIAHRRDVHLARWAVECGYHDQAHLTRECRRLLGVTPGEFLAQSSATCTADHDHAASYAPMLRPRSRSGHGRFGQERRTVPA